VIPGKVRFSLDVRAPTDSMRERAADAMRAESSAIAARRNVAVTFTPIWEARTTLCAVELQRQIAEAIDAEGIRVHHLPSGAGHDGMAIVAIAPVAMLFVRCAGGISHNPAEAVSPRRYRYGHSRVRPFYRALQAAGTPVTQCQRTRRRSRRF
jgi:acetylornithine deacetylase/succinyl-diaminopimelate desuccinylase-like protein